MNKKTLTIILTSILAFSVSFGQQRNVFDIRDSKSDVIRPMTSDLE